MKILISQAVITDLRHPDNGKKRDLLIEGGKIVKIAARITEAADKIVKASGLCVSVGWMDFRANFRDPGAEHKENLDSGLKAAAAGGFAAVAVSPDTTPPVDNKGAVEYLLNRSKTGVTALIPVGALSKGLKGESLAELFDMNTAGAAMFGDDKYSIRESGLLQRALLYAKNFGGTVVHFPYDTTLVPNGQMNEGIQSTRLGLKGIPAMAEASAVMRDLSLLEYTEGRLHLGPLSTAAAVQAVKAARKKGLKVTCETTAAHLAYSDAALSDFSSAHKLMPPLREEANRKKLIKALKAGDIDVVSSDHSPEDEERKKCEFDFAAFGTAGIETFFPLLWDALADEVPADRLIAAFSIGPREAAGIPVPKIAEGEKAELTLFSTSGATDFAERPMHSKAYNIAERGKTLRGKVIGVINRGKISLNP